jgi:hypothetical protein
MECDAPLRAETPAQWASLLVEDMTVPEDVQQWWDTDRHCLFECPEDVEAVRAEILAFDTISGVSGDPWSSFGIRHFMCCGTCL